MDAVVLSGPTIRLEPLTDQHRDALRAAAADERIWAHTLVDARGPEFERWFDDALAEQRSGRRLPFAVRRFADQAMLGSTSYLDPNVKHRHVEIGSTWYIPEVWGTHVNPECKFLLLAHAFETLGLNRVSFCTDARNLRSQAAIAKLGATKEGVLRSHMITQGGRIRDTVLYSIIRAEWDQVRERLSSRLAHPQTTV